MFCLSDASFLKHACYLNGQWLVALLKSGGDIQLKDR